MRMLNRRFVAACAAMIAFASAAPAQVNVVGTGDPNVDVPAVQAAVDHGRRVILRGHFSFDRPPTVPTGPLAGCQCTSALAMILVSKPVAISGALDEQGEMASIGGGTIPLYVEAPGARVGIQGLRFIRPKFAAIAVFAAGGLAIASNRIEGLDTGGFSNLAGILISTGLLPSPAQPNQPENISGTLFISNNDIDVAIGTAGINAQGIFIVSAGKHPDKEVDLYVAGNNIRNSTERAINIYQLGGRAFIERNVVTTSTTAGTAGGAAPDVIHVVAPGSYLIAHNSIESRWAKGAGIRVQSQYGDWPITGAVVVDNDVTMSPPDGTVFDVNSAAIEIRGSGQGNAVLNNRIRGRANFALSVNGVPSNTTFVNNDLQGFTSSRSDVFVDAPATNTVVVGRQSAVEDYGAGTVVVPIP